MFKIGYVRYIMVHFPSKFVYNPIQNSFPHTFHQIFNRKSRRWQEKGRYLGRDKERDLEEGTTGNAEYKTFIISPSLEL